MRVMTSLFITEQTAEHPYEGSPGYVARIHTFHFSEDERFIAGYWEAPPGSFDAEIGAQTELNYVLEGEIELWRGNECVTAGKGDCFVAEPGDKLTWKVTKAIRTIYFIYPAGKEISGFFRKLESTKKKGRRP